jgi:hypothetical protein
MCERVNQVPTFGHFLFEILENFRCFRLLFAAQRIKHNVINELRVKAISRQLINY